MTDVHVDVIATYVGPQAVVINYRSHRGRLVDELLIFDGALGREGRGIYL